MRHLFDHLRCLIGFHPVDLYVTERHNAHWWYTACRVCGKGSPFANEYEKGSK